MNKYPRSDGRPKRVSEPVQVYLAADDQVRLEWLTSSLGTTKSDVLRRGLEALERQLADPAAHPALGVMSLGEAVLAKPSDYDVAREHDRFLAESEQASWKPALPGRRDR